MDVVDALDFLQANHHAVVATFRRDGRPQLSPVLCGVDDDRIVVSTREVTAKRANLRRDPRVSIVVLGDGFFGDWIQIDGTAEVVGLPEAMDGLVDYYRAVSGEHPDWDEFRSAMTREGRVLVRITPERTGPDDAGRWLRSAG